MSETPNPSGPKSILVVDDEPNILSMLRLVLSNAGYEVKCAGNAFDALFLFRQRFWDAVITDRAMPGLTGEDMAAQMRARRADVPILMLTGAVQKLQRPELFHAVLTKPFLVAELLQSLGRALQTATGHPVALGVSPSVLNGHRAEMSVEPHRFGPVRL